ncbi:MAG: alpha/beta fold hydrolase [Labilithrix sp.]|nr:alpha/beta fold hydrolase [Labilithrix sp.]MBX3220592.1 alpha/beta fold hydrolase [Labilithrix sp.]
MKPVLLPLAERLGRAALRRRGISSGLVQTALGALHTYDAPGGGDLPATVILHGLGSAATPFGPLLARLQPHVRRIVAPDYPGHGFSAHARERLTPGKLFESISTALDATLREPAIVVGNSLGGALALRYALTRPERVRALVLVSPAGARSSDEEWAAIRAAFAVTSRAEARRFLERLYHRPPWFLPLLLHEFPETLARRAVRELLESASNDDAPEPTDLASLTMPILFVWGRSERLLPSTHLEYFTRHLPKHAVIERPDGFGHCPHFDAPGVLARRIVAFARSVRD